MYTFSGEEEEEPGRQEQSNSEMEEAEEGEGGEGGGRQRGQTVKSPFVIALVDFDEA